ncbi:cell wall-binding repeat-containing protein [Corynebacterium breve]|uniref:Cell wall-binding repeat-containing protein n=1 Tax=Corynebacterium breve TaxID=3049799 RepID=A0ABY8VIY8_9CORY|nr:cell wall-binding repeat-containing protein [Corynebacterium breve]WIM69017.1 cell wall-binding repeat-containing protein [Corynebacterium breve]
MTACGEAGPRTDQPAANGASEAELPALETDGPEVIADANGTGIEVSQLLFDESDAVVIASESEEDQRRGATLAVELGAPLLTRVAGAEALVDKEVERLGAKDIHEVPSDDQKVTETEPVVDKQDSLAAAVAELEPGEEATLQLPPFFATNETSLAAVATARAAGAEIQVLDVADPRLTSESMQTVAEQDTLALGEQFGSSEEFADRVELASNGELPGGGGLVFPGRRMVALYGHPSGGALGMLGEQSPEDSVARLQGFIDEYQPLEDQPVLPAFEIIATVASEFPGDDGDFSNEATIEELLPLVDAITEAGGYAFLDLQPGRANFLDQAKRYEELLKRPNVGLALDPEWNIGPNEMPMQRVGSAEAHEINEVADWLAQLTRDNNLPQKGLILHQFQLQMLRDREQINTDHPELAFILHADGHGVEKDKFATWDVMRKDLSPDYFMAWKNFEDEDLPMFTPQETYEKVDPRPWFVSYQ